MIGDFLYQLTPREEQDPNASEFFATETVNYGIGVPNDAIAIAIPDTKLLLLDYLHVTFKQTADTLTDIFVGFTFTAEDFYGETNLALTNPTNRTWILNKLPLAHPRSIRVKGQWSGTVGSRTLKLDVGGLLLPLGTLQRR